MKCPKCNYISFDYNQVCPKCNKNISSEQQRMNLPDYKPSPPYLLGSLLGETGRSEEAIFSEGRNFDFGLELEESDVTIAAADLTEEDLSNKAEEEIETLEPLSGLEFEEDGGEKTRGPESLLQRDPDLTVALPGDDEGEEPTVNLDDFSYSHDGPDKEAIMDGTLDEEELGIDLEDLALDEIASSNRGPEKAGNLDDAEKVTLVIDTKGEKSSKGIEETELELELEKIDDK
ncbi:MAG: hypothetical protein R6V46_09580 [Desulfatiglandaceae bacterium]